MTQENNNDIFNSTTEVHLEEYFTFLKRCSSKFQKNTRTS
jgi:hypothetical protein